MYIIKNALRCIGRSKGRNILIGIISIVIAISACLGLSIRQAAESAKASTLEGLNVTATISYDRASAMGNISGGRPGMGGGFQGGGFNRDDFANMMSGGASLTLEEYQKYAEAESVQSFYYTLTAYFNGSDNFSPVSDESGDGESESDGELEGSLDAEDGGMSGFPGGMGGMMGEMFGGLSSGDFSVIGYSSYSSMTAFMNSTASIIEGTMFEEGTSELVCVISEELSMYNDGLAVGDTIVITNPILDTETYTLTIVGIYTSSENNDFSMSMFGASQDPANRIYMSAAALQTVLDASNESSTTITDDYGGESESKITGTLDATYVFADPDSYYDFEVEVRDLGLSEDYTVSSSDISAYENSLTPLNTLGTMAGWFLIVILIIGGIILVVLNIFNVRERKYEVGVLTAMGMKKWKVAAQFMCEILVVTMVAVIIGAGVGAVSSVPVTNALLEGQVNSQSSMQSQIEQNFGGIDMGGMFPGGNMGGMPGGMPDIGGNNPFGDMFGGAVGDMIGGAADYITEVDSAMNLTVVFQMIGVGLLLTLIAGAASVLFIMRYDPLKILANRD